MITRSGVLQLVALILLSACTRLAPEYQIVEPTGREIRLPTESLDRQRVHFYTLKFEEKNVNFFVRRDGTGKLQAHFDACYNCFQYKMGYIHKGDQVVCLACKIGYDLDSEIWDYVGPCVPISLPSADDGDYLKIDRDRLEKGARYF